MKEDGIYLAHIKEAIDKIYLYTNDGYECFLDDCKTQDAVIRNFEIIGEACKKLTNETKSLRADIPWREVAGLRDVLIHDYMGVDVKEVWNIVTNHLPSLKTAIEELSGSV